MEKRNAGIVEEEDQDFAAFGRPWTVSLIPECGPRGPRRHARHTNTKQYRDCTPNHYSSTTVRVLIPTTVISITVPYIIEYTLLSTMASLSRLRTRLMTGQPGLVAVSVLVFRPSRAPVCTRLRSNEVAASHPRCSHLLPTNPTGPFLSRAFAYTLTSRRLLAQLERHPKTILSASRSKTPELLQLHVFNSPLFRYSYSNPNSNKHHRLSVLFLRLSTVDSTL